MPDIQLSLEEARVLGVLIEKELSTPDQYPLSANALQAGVNQRSNRDPVMEMTAAELHVVVGGLRQKGLVGTAHASGGRVERFRHSAREVLGLERGELAVLAELFLRGPQMPGELRSRASRMHELSSREALEGTLTALAAKGLARRLEPQPGARAARFAEVLTEGAQGSASPATRSAAEQEQPEPARAARTDLETRVRELERRVDARELERERDQRGQVR